MTLKIPHSLDFFQAGINAYLVHYCLPDLDVHLAKAIMKAWNLDEDDIRRLALKACPSLVQNLIAADACAEKFGDLSGVDGFYFCDAWRLDLDERFSQNGYLMPVRNSRGWIERLRAFRNPQDERGFLVKVRKVAA